VGEYTTEGFVVHKGSKGRAEIVPSIQGTSHERMRSQLIVEGVLAENAGSAGSMLVFTRDHLFSSPSTAAMAVMGRSANGWVEWKTASGKTLDEVKRQGVISTDAD
jgi:hypothetical protein